MEVINKLHNEFAKRYTDHEVKLDWNDKKTVATISGRKDWNAGFEVDIAVDKSIADISNSSKISDYAGMGAIGLSIILTILFGSEILYMMGLFVDAGSTSFTLRLFYIIPLLIFLIPIFIVAWILGRRFTLKDEDQLNYIKQLLEDNGYDVELF